MVYAFGFGYKDASRSPESISIVCTVMLLYLEILKGLENGRATNQNTRCTRYTTCG